MTQIIGVLGEDKKVDEEEKEDEEEKKDEEERKQDEDFRRTALLLIRFW